MKKELLKLQARNREINDRLTAMYVKAENEKREFNDEENREERELKRELEQNHREIMNSCDAAAIGALREQQDKSAQLREFFKAVKEKRENATTILNSPVTGTSDNNTTGNLEAGKMIPLNIKELIDTKVEGLELPADLTMLTGVVGDEVWPYSIDDAEVRVAGEVDTIAEQGLNFANVKALSERVACAIAISNKAIDNAYFDLYSFVLYKIQKAVAILKAKRVYSHAQFNDNLK
jgi:HK97 family phage major capsid protein